MYIGFSWECHGWLRVLAWSDNHIFTFFVADENDLFLFQAEKRQQVCETGQRLRSLESGLKGQQHYILGIFWNLFVVLYSGILTPILLFTILYMVVTHATLRVISSECQFKSFRRLWLYQVPARSSFLQIWRPPLCSFNIEAILSSMWVPHAAGIFQTRMNEGEVGKIAGYCSID